MVAHTETCHQYIPLIDRFLSIVKERTHCAKSGFGGTKAIPILDVEIGSLSIDELR